MIHRAITDLEQADVPQGRAVRLGVPAFLAIGDTVPSDAATGYASGAIFQNAATSDATNSLYINTGDEDSAAFVAVNVAAPVDLTLSATGNQTIPDSALAGGGASVKVPNTAALTVTLPGKANVPHMARLILIKSAAAAEIVTVAAHGDDTLRGSTGQIDALNDRVEIVYDKTYGPIVVSSIIA